MSSQTTPAIRQRFYQQHQEGATYPEIAQQYGVSPACVRYWCRRQRDGGGVQTQHCGRQPGLLQQFAPAVKETIIAFRVAHPRWGPLFMRHRLAKQPELAGLRLPSVAQIGRFLYQHSRLRRLRPLSPAPVWPRPATQVHQRWALDFKESIALLDGSRVNLHTVRDPVGAACLTAQVTPAAHSGAGHKVTAAQAQATMRHAFALWQTLPQELLSDNDPALVGNPGEDFPSRFTLWLVGLDIAYLRSRPGIPTDNAAVERCHQTICNCALVGADATHIAHVQQVLDTLVHELAFEVPSRAHGCHNRPPVVAHPELLTPPRPFSPQQEWQRFDLGRVDRYLANFLWLRKVEKSGQVSLGGRHQRYSVHARYGGHYVLICFDVDTRHFAFFESQPPYRELCARPARNLTATAITGLPDPDPVATAPRVREG